MFQTTMPKNQLLDVLRKNREAHRAIFLKAQDKFRDAVINALEDRLRAARDGKTVDLYVRLEEPKDYTSDYDRVIGMLEVSTDAAITLDESSYAQYVMDDWNWKRQWATTNASYGIAS